VSFRIYCYPWDLGDEGPDRALEQIAGWGLDGINLCAAYHRFQAIMPHNPVRKTIAAAQSYLYFEPDWSRYSDRLRPQLSPEGGNAFKESVDAARRHGLKVCAWLIALHHSPGFQNFPDYWLENVFGEKYPFGLCHAYQDVQTFLANLASDLVRMYGVDELELESAHWHRFFNIAPQIHDRIGIRLGPLEELALSLCFCPACTQRASGQGIDVERLKASLRAVLAETFKTGEGKIDPEADLLADFGRKAPDLDGYLNVRADTVAELLGKIKAAAGRPVAVIYYPVLSGHDADRLARTIDRLVTLAYSASVSEVERQVQQALTTLPDPTRWRVALSLFAEHVPNSTTLNEHLRNLSKLGITEFAFYNYGLASSTALDRLRSAISTRFGLGAATTLT
jgi:hypothetical protein